MPDFKERISNVYHGMKKRTAEKRDKNRRIIRHGQELPFTKQQFQDWFLLQFGGNPNGVIKCCYCSRPVDAFSCEVDHGVPLRRGGSPGLDNLCLPCDVCNAVKGKMTPEEFRWLLDRMSEMSLKFGRDPVTDVMSRLEKAVKLAQSVNWSRIQKKKEQAAMVLQPAMVDDDF